MPKIIDLDLPEYLAETLNDFATRSMNSSHDHSQIVERALIEFFEKRGVPVEA